ncbi:RNA-directed DNA polymerase, eukaryota [Tanacetum coccineum]
MQFGQTTGTKNAIYSKIIKKTIASVEENCHVSVTNWNIGDIGTIFEMQAADLERSVSRDEIRLAVWNCGENKSPGPDGYTFEFFRKYWNFVGLDFCEAVEYFFETGLFSKGCNSSFVALIPKVADAKFVNDFHPISLIGSVYKVVKKVLANRLALVIADLVSDTQSAFVANRQILDGSFILNEILHWCKRKKKQAMFFKVDFAKAYDSVRWDYLLDVLQAFGFGQTWCKLKQGDPLSSYLFILIMESLHMSLSRAVDEGEWSDANLKEQVLGVGISRSIVMQAASSIGCGVMHKQFRYLGVMVGECMSRHQAWADTVLKLRSRLSNWKVKPLSIGGRLTLLKSVLGASPLYNMSIFKVPKGVLKSMEAIRSNFFNGADSKVKKITWAGLDKILASKKNGGLGVSSFHALNRALLLKWVWRFISQDGSLWFRVIQAVYGPSIVSHPVNLSSNWCSIVRELHLLTDKGFDFLSHCKKRTRDDNRTCFWVDKWIGDKPFQNHFPRLFALELDKEVLVVDKMKVVVTHSFRRPVRAGSEHQQMVELNSLMESVSLSQSHNIWICDCNTLKIKSHRNGNIGVLRQSTKIKI